MLNFSYKEAIVYDCLLSNPFEPITYFYHEEGTIHYPRDQ